MRRIDHDAAADAILRGAGGDGGGGPAATLSHLNAVWEHPTTGARIYIGNRVRGGGRCWHEPCFLPVALQLLISKGGRPFRSLAC